MTTTPQHLNTWANLLHLARQRHFWWPWLLVALAWAVALLATMRGWLILIDHHYLLEESGFPWPLAALVFLTGWQVMIVAMMFPISLSTHTARRIHRVNARQRLALVPSLVAYSLVWTAFAVLAFSGDTLIHRLVDAWPWLATHTFVIGASTFAVAGLYQFSRWKVACLTACQNPPGAPPDGEKYNQSWVWRNELWHSFASVGCCWAQMLIMFGVGVGGPGWMLGLTAAMVGETNTPRDWRMRQTIGIIFCALALLWLAHPAWLAQATVA